MQEQTRVIEFDRLWTLSEVLRLALPMADITVREYLVALTVQEAMQEHLPVEWGEHVSAFDADTDAIIQERIGPDGELQLMVGVRVTAFNPN